MAITGSVGANGANARADAVVIQVALNLVRQPGDPPLAVDGSVGPGTIGAIRQFQANVMQAGTPDGRVDPGGQTLAALRRRLPPFITSHSLAGLVLQGIMPTATAAKVAQYAAPMQRGMARHAITSALRQAHFLAQLGHESGGLVYNEELADGRAYDGRADLGNTRPGDGPRFKGRGLIQLTGRANYKAFGDSIGRDLTTEPNNRLVATDPGLAVDAACWFWDTRSLNPLADADDIESITRRVNGGLNGFQDRKAYLARAKWFFGI
ncbi:glycoside hydrolase family 19 protein [Rhodopila sp.]|uniref:glycoside hydrolase family 19 protein n=1 Tax=Rhodopila sp. TaxID=2480087 RepID=UPI002CFDF8DE|nr:glycoside hydrolase family 19 protein [Rhodopila sp.]HVZ07761.1 glycoside hydrolase family 19 protein [Rhodopila sp.]